MRYLLILTIMSCLPWMAQGQQYRYDTQEKKATAKTPQQPVRPYSYNLPQNQAGVRDVQRVQPLQYDYDVNAQRIQTGPIVNSPVQPVPSQQSYAEKPAYCNELPEMYDKSGARIMVANEGGGRTSLPRFASRAVKEYKIQCAILRKTHPANYPFHPYLTARWRPCEEVWVIESRKSFKNRNEADQHRKELQDLGYGGAYIVEMIGYEADQ